MLLHRTIPKTESESNISFQNGCHDLFCLTLRVIYQETPHKFAPNDSFFFKLGLYDRVCPRAATGRVEENSNTLTRSFEGQIHKNTSQRSIQGH